MRHPAGPPEPSWNPRQQPGHTVPVPAVVAPRLPYLEVVLGALWWTVGSAALSAGTGTVVLAAGLGLAGWMVVSLRGRYGRGTPLSRGGRTRVLRIALIAVVGVAGAATLLGAIDWGELTVPLSCAIVGMALLSLSSTLDARSLLGVGAALMVVGAAGALLALDSAGRLYPQGVVGMVAGALLWAEGALRTGLLAELRGRR